MKNCMLITAFVLVLIILGGCSEKKQENSLPNIIFILADDMGYGDVSAYNEDSKIETPFIDQLADIGAGNPNSCVAFNPGVFRRIMSVTPYEDYTAGETNNPGSIRFSQNENGVIDGSQIHILSYLGRRWGVGNPRL